MISQIKIRAAPIKMDAGISILWTELLKIPRAICGTAIPTKAMGPVKAVMLPANMPVAITIKILVLFILTPKAFA